jgi:LmbE family N-acetylglucosaminyl deacetylase
MFTPRTILVIQAHPDDAEIFCAGTLALLREKGHRIVITTITSGGMGGIGMDVEATAATRKAEAAEAAGLIESEYHCLDQRDGFLFDGPEIRIETIELIRRERADVVLTHLPNDYHPDHRATSSIAEAATLMSTLPNVPCPIEPLSATPLLYHTTPFNLTDHLGHPYTPHFYVDITTVIDIKRRMIGSHQSQIELMQVMFGKGHFVEDMLDDHDRKLGPRIGTAYAEAFWQHLGGGFPHTPFLQQALREYVRLHLG